MACKVGDGYVVVDKDEPFPALLRQKIASRPSKPTLALARIVFM